MSAVELSSIKWEENGEMSAQDALNLACQLTKTEEHDLASSRLELETTSVHPSSSVKNAE
ncbi:MAG: hypothetical protein L7T26_14475 [Pseudomonadales bacterium]|nr:hypothetical protein [Pseudomonadales bacterium]